MNQAEWIDAKNTLISVRDWIRFGASAFERAGLFYGHGTDNPWDEAVALVVYALNLSHEFDDKLIDARLTSFEKDHIIALFEARILKRLPVPYLTHKAYYAGFEFYVDDRVLIPRSPIVELIENQFQPWIEPSKVNAILDIGTGSGCLAILSAHYFTNSVVDAVDIDPNALQVARTNIEKYHLNEHVFLYESDLFTGVKEKTYDVILSNPPYVAAEVMANLPPEFLHEPKHALASGEDGLSHIKRIIHEAKMHLNPGGILIAEVGNSAAATQLAYPNLDFMWLEFKRGSDGVFLLNYNQLS